MPTLLNKPSIFDSYQQIMQIDPRDIKLQGDRVLLRDIPEGDRIGSLYIPEICQDQERIRRGVVLAVGPGDACIETPESQTSVDGDGYVRLRRRSVTSRSGRIDMFTRPGDTVLYSRRLEAEVYIGGEKLVMVHEEQAILAILSIKGKFHDDPVDIKSIFLLRDRVIVNRDKLEQKTPGGIILPQSCSEERPEGIVIAVGPGRPRVDGTWEECEAKPGDHVVFDKYSGSDVKIRGERVLIMRDSEILGVLYDKKKG